MGSHCRGCAPEPRPHRSRARLAGWLFLVGAGLGLVVFFMRMWIPESPRWLITHGRPSRSQDRGRWDRRRGFSRRRRSPARGRRAIAVSNSRPYPDIGRRRCSLQALSQPHDRSVWCSCSGAGVFLQPAIFFTYALDSDLNSTSSSRKTSSWYSCTAGSRSAELPSGRSCSGGWASSNTVGRRSRMSRNAHLRFVRHLARRQAAALLLNMACFRRRRRRSCWMVVFFFASPAASAAYLTVSETFPIEVRALTIAIFYAVGTGVGGVAAPFIFGRLIESGFERQRICRICVHGGADAPRFLRRRAFCRRRRTPIPRRRSDATVGGSLSEPVSSLRQRQKRSGGEGQGKAAPRTAPGQLLRRFALLLSNEQSYYRNFRRNSAVFLSR